MNKKLKSAIKLSIKISVTVVALYFVFKKIDYRELLVHIKGANVAWLLFAAVMFIISKIISSIRLNSYFKNIDVYISEKSNLKLYWLGMFYNLSLPGGIGGDGYKVYYLNRKYKTKVIDLFWAVMLDRVIGVLALFIMAVIIFYFVPYHFSIKWLVGLLIPLSIAVAYFVYLKFFKTHVNIFFKTNLQSFFVQVFQLLSALFIINALGITENYASLLFLFLVSSIVAVLPIAIGGIGSREVTFMIGANILQLDASISVAISFLFFFITAVVSFYGLIYLIKPNRIGD